jgi:neutral ceramidase
MKIGASQVEITPQVGAELSGFALRTQPSTGVLDRLWLRSLFLEDGSARLLWLHCDLIGFDARIVVAFRIWARVHFGLLEAETLLTATHTHSGPCTIHLEEAGAYDEGYAGWLQLRLQESAQAAMRQTESVTVCTAETELGLAVDRRKTASAHVDSRLGVVGFRRADGTFAAVIVNGAIHPVALGPDNRQISGDLLGLAAAEITRQLPGNPIALVTNGACGNLNPPALNVSYAQCETWGREIATVALSALARATAKDTPGQAGLRVAAARCALPLDTLDRAGLDAQFAKITADLTGGAEWRAKVRHAADRWRQSLVSAIEQDRVLTHREIELCVVRLGDSVFVGANAELFSIFTEWLRHELGAHVYVLGYANGNCGYVCPRAAYAEGGYEAERAHVFYGGHRFRPGGLERLATEATALVRRELAPTRDASPAAGAPAASTQILQP